MSETLASPKTLLNVVARTRSGPPLSVGWTVPSERTVPTVESSTDQAKSAKGMSESGGNFMGITLGGWMMARSAHIASRMQADGEGDADFLRGKILTARFFADHVMSQAPALSAAVTRGSESVLAMEEALL